jgi:hypothetical protein
VGVDVGSCTFAALLALLAGAPAGAVGVADVHALTSCRPTTLQIRPALVARNPRRLTRVEGMPVVSPCEPRMTKTPGQ